MSDFRKLINHMAGIFFLAGIFYIGYGFATAENRVRKLCSEISAGIQFSEVAEFAATHGLSIPKNMEGPTFIVETRTFGRYGCRVVMASGYVQSVSYDSLD